MIYELKETEFGPIPFDWNFIPASQFCTRVTDGTHDSPKQQKTGKHLVTSKHIKGRNIDFENAYLISEDDFNKINLRSSVDQWDVIISMIGEYCGFSFVERNKEIDYAVKNVGLFKTGNKNKAFWLYYFLNSKIGRFILETNKSGTSQPYISLGALRQLPILIPDCEKESKQIINILISIDDKIDLLQRQNKTLEQLTEMLFRQWFMNEANENWNAGKLEDFAERIQYGFTQSAKFENIGPKFLRITDIQGGQVNWESVPFCLTNENDFLKYQLKTGDILVARTGASTGENIYMYKPPKAIFASYLIRIQFSKPSLARYVALHMRSSVYFGYIEGILSGSAQPNANAHELTSFEIPLPPDDRLDSFFKIVSELDEKKHHNQTQIRILTQLRDTLLPKLISGEVRVSQNEKNFI